MNRGKIPPMKTQVIQLESHDDLISVRDKMSWSQTPRILLVWPVRGDRILNRKLDLTLLERKAIDQGAQLALVSDDPEILFHAAQLDIPVFKTTGMAQKRRWRRRRGQPSRDRLPLPEPGSRPDIYSLREKAHPPGAMWPRHPLVQIVFFILGVLAVAMIGAVLFPSAKITLTPQSAVQEISFTALTGPSITEVNSSGAIPTRKISVILEGVSQKESTGALEIPSEAASGRVTFTNLTSQAVIIPAGTVVTTLDSPPIKFSTTRQGQAPSGPGNFVDLPVVAVVPGSGSNIESGAVQSVEGTLGVQLTVSNTLAIAGGIEQSLASPTNLDRRQLFRDLLETLRESASEQIVASLAPGDLLLSERAFLSQTLEESYIPAGDVPADTVEITLRVEFEALIIRGDDLQNLALAVLDASVPDGFVPINEEFSFSLVSDPAIDLEENGEWEMVASRNLRATLPEYNAAALAQGLLPTEATQSIQDALPLASPPTIQIQPEWWPRMPFLAFRIEVVEQE